MADLPARWVSEHDGAVLRRVSAGHVEAEGAAVAEPTTMTMMVQRLSEDVTLIVEGEIDAASAPRLSRCLHHELEHPLRSLAVDLTEARFSGIAGMAVLACALEHAEANGLTVTVHYPHSSAEELDLRLSTCTPGGARVPR
jgi:anti-anti-sigma factor